MGEKPYKEFYEQLREAYLAAGPPTYVWLSRIMRKQQIEDPHRTVLGPSALQVMTKGGGKLLPRWAALSSVIEALRTAARETGLDPEGVGTVQEWHQRLLRARGSGAAGRGDRPAAL